jgi:Alpha-kinase family
MQGGFKTAHPGEIQLDEGSDPLPFKGSRVCVKQIFEKRKHTDDNGTQTVTGIVRLKGRHELQAFSNESNCLIWSSFLLDLTYKFVDREVRSKGKPKLPIPALHFTRGLIAIVQSSSVEKAFLVEELIDLGDAHPFIKYLDNRFPISRVPLSAPPDTQNIADFLVFAQHVQWEKTQHSVFTSDYQGAGDLLTDPQITSNPYVHPIFGIIHSP